MKQYFGEIKTSPRGYKGYAGIYVRLYVNGELAGSTGGGGYDMVGVCFGQWLNKNFKERLEKLAEKEIEAMKTETERFYNDKGGGIYGLMVVKDNKSGEVSVHADGATGISQMFKIIEALGGGIEQSGLLNKYIITL